MLFLVLTVSVFSGHWSDGGRYDAPVYSGSLDYSFALETTCIFLELIGAIFSGLEVYHWLQGVKERY